MCSIGMGLSHHPSSADLPIGVVAGRETGATTSLARAIIRACRRLPAGHKGPNVVYWDDNDSCVPVRHAGRHPAIGNGGGNGHAEARESLELSAGRGVGIDTGHDDGAHVNNLALRGADSKARDAG